VTVEFASTTRTTRGEGVPRVVKARSKRSRDRGWGVTRWEGGGVVTGMCAQAFRTTGHAHAPGAEHGHVKATEDLVLLEVHHAAENVHEHLRER
jgi:hypothetical protein